MKLNVGIVGTGLSGRLFALECIQRGWSVTLFDGDTNRGQQSCGWVAAGMIAPYSELEASEPLLFHLGRESLQLWPTILNQLPEPVFFGSSGTVIVAHPQDTGHITRFRNAITHKLAALLPAAEQEQFIKKIPREQLNDWIPGIAPVIQDGYWIPGEGHVNSVEFYAASSAAFKNAHVPWYENTLVEEIEPYQITIANQRTHVFDLVCDCRGLGAKQNWPGLRGIRGEVVWLDAPDVELHCPVRLMHPRHPIYISPRPNHRYVIGATSIESEDMSPISLQSMMELLSVAYTLHPGFAEARIVNTLTQCRPALNDHLPKISYTNGLLRLNGLYRHGYMAGPAVVQEALRLIEGGTAALHYPELIATHQHEGVL
jgi:glycine oxidase